MKFYLTVGTGYAQTPHPQGLHPDSWVEVEAEDYWKARELVVQNFGTAWAFLYTEDAFRPHYHPNGCQMTIS